MVFLDMTPKKLGMENVAGARLVVLRDLKRSSYAEPGKAE